MLATLRTATALAGLLSIASVAQAQAQPTFSSATGRLLLPTLLVDGARFTDVAFQIDEQGRLVLTGFVPPGAPPTPGSPRTLELSYAPQSNTQYYYDGGVRQVATCSNLAQAAITLRIPANATAAAPVPLVIALAGWAPSGSPPTPVPQDLAALDQFTSAGLAAATLQYRGCDNWSSPLIARTRADESFDIASSDFGLALAAIRLAVAQQALPVDTSRIVAAGTSFSSNFIYTVATQHRLQGALALTGGCDYACTVNGQTWGQPNDFRVNGQRIAVAAISGANDALYAPHGLGSSGYGAPAARARILGGIADPALRPAAFYTHVEPAIGHELNASMWARATQFAQCLTGARPAADCAAFDR